jgi:UDP-N-acetylglucosamine--N-acetylmuramyl-(pentapeptide) pyrophosphoryl-undecaprenol N-acetylglucosamine transferase
VKKRDPNLSVLAIGSNSPTDRELFESAGYAFQPTSAAALAGVRLGLPLNVLRMSLAVVTAFRKVGEFRPNAALSTGAYASVPGAAACLIRRVPQILIAVDASPGHAARIVGRFSGHVATATEQARNRFPRADVEVTGLPLRSEFDSPDPDRARRQLDIGASRPVILIVGGSQGSRVINDAVGSILESLLESGAIVHLTGPADIAAYESRKRGLPDRIRSQYHPIAFLKHGIADLMAAADLAVARAGGTTHELAAVGLPSILIPGLFAQGHQQANAHRMSDAGAAVTLTETDLDRQTLLTTIIELVSDQDRLNKMAAAAASLGTRGAADSIAERLVQMATRGDA